MAEAYSLGGQHPKQAIVHGYLSTYESGCVDRRNGPQGIGG